MYKKLILISISNIQSLIEKKGKIRDLYGASEAVKNLIIHINDILEKLDNFEILIPQNNNGKSIDPPNFILAELQTDLENDEDVENFLRTAIIVAPGQLSKDTRQLQIFIASTNLSNGNYRSAYKSLLLKIKSYKMNRLSGNLWHDNRKEKDEAGKIKAPSTSTVASNEWQSKFDGEGQIESIRAELQSIASKSNYEEFNFEELYYKEDLNNYYQIEDTEVKERLDRVKEIMSAPGIEMPSSYFALVRIDIDNLGWLLSGEELSKGVDLKQFQKDLYCELNKFVINVNKYISENGLQKKGERLSVYMGGDDLLFFSPLNKVFSYLQFIHAEFSKVKDWYHNGYRKKISYSTSLVIAHRKNPLQQVISESVKALKGVKDRVESKGGMALSLIYRSGNVRSVYFNEVRNEYVTIELIKQLHKDGDLSKSFLYSLEREFEVIGDRLDMSMFLILKNEISRIYLRKIGSEITEESKGLVKYFIDACDLFIEDLEFKLYDYLNYLHILLKWSNEIIELEGRDEVEICEINT